MSTMRADDSPRKCKGFRRYKVAALFAGPVAASLLFASNEPDEKTACRSCDQKNRRKENSPSERILERPRRRKPLLEVRPEEPNECPWHSTDPNHLPKSFPVRVNVDSAVSALPMQCFEEQAGAEGSPAFRTGKFGPEEQEIREGHGSGLRLAFANVPQQPVSNATGTTNISRGACERLRSRRRPRRGCAWARRPFSGARAQLCCRPR